MAQALGRERTDANRVRLAVLYTLTRQARRTTSARCSCSRTWRRATPARAAVKQLAYVLAVQVAERMRAVREEQVKADAALQKLEALREMERSLLRDRVRSGGGGGAVGRRRGGGGGSGGRSMMQAREE